MSDTSYVVTVPHFLNPAVTFASFGVAFKISKRAGDQLKRSLAKVDKRYASAKVVQRATAQKRGVWGV